MDFEQQLEKAEKLPEPSLVGASLRSADDSVHNNYIHPEKSKKSSSKGTKSKKKTIAASLDDLISEGALLGSEEDFERFLDDDGHVKDDAKYKETKDPKDLIGSKSPLGESFQEFLKNNPGALPEKESFEEFLKNKDNIPESPIKLGGNSTLDPILTPSLDPKPVALKSSLDPRPLDPKNSSDFYNQDDYSTPNLSEYQLQNQIKDHSDLLSSIQSYDPNVLPKFEDSNAAFRRDRDVSQSGSPKPASSPSKLDSSSQPHLDIASQDSIHAPFFHTERSRSRSRSRSANPAADRSRSRSAVKPHLARGDSYKNTNVDEPIKYELPPDLAAATNLDETEEEEQGDDDRRTRHSRPTMGESIAKAEAASEDSVPDLSEQFKRDASLVTTGDYTNFNVDTPSNEFSATDRLYSTRSASSTNYLRSISRSRSRARPNFDASHDNEKNDANPEELVREGALVTDDPYSTIDHLDTMVEEVLHPKSGSEQKKNVNFEIDDKVFEDKGTELKPETEAGKIAELDDLKITKEDGLPEDKTAGSGPVLTAKDIKLEEKDLPKEEEQIIHDPEISEVSKQDVSDLAADKIKDEEHEPAGPSISVKDIDVSDEQTEKTNIVEAEPTEAEAEAEAKVKADLDDLKITKEDGLPEDKTAGSGPVLTAKDIKLEEKDLSKEDEEIIHDPEISEVSKQDVSDLAAEKIRNDDQEPSGPSVNAQDIIVDSEKQTGVDSEEVNESKETEESKELENASNVNDSEAKNSTLDTEESEVSNASEVSKEPVEGDKEEETAADEEAALAEKKSSESTEESDKIELDNSADAEEKKETDADADADAEAKETKPEAEKKEADSEVDEKNDPEAEGKGSESADQSKEIDIETGTETGAEKKEDESEGIEKKEVTGAETEIEDDKKASPDEAEMTVDETSEGSNVPILGGAISTATAAVAGIAKTIGGTGEHTKDEASKDEDLDDIEVSAEEIRKHNESLPIYLFTSLAGGMQIVPRTNRLVTILQANGIKFEYRDLGTDEEAKKLWKRQANGKPLPGVVRGDDFIGNFKDIDDANEEYQLHELLYDTI